MPSRKGPCPCPNCHGAIRVASTLKRHKELEDLRNAQLAQAHLGSTSVLAPETRWNDLHRTGLDRNDEYDGSDESSEDERSESGAKRRRVHSPDFEDSTHKSNDLENMDNNNSTNPENNAMLSNSSDSEPCSPREPHSALDVSSPDSRKDDIPPLVHDNEYVMESDNQLSPKSPTSSSSRDSPMVSRRSSPAPSDSEFETESSSEEEDGHHDSGQEEIEDIASRLEHIKVSQDFIKEIKEATLENGKLEEDAIHRLRNPTTETFDLDNPDVRLSVDLYMSCMNASEDTYNEVRRSIQRRFPEVEILSYHLVKKRVAEITGIESILDDMCINSCIAFTGPFSGLEACPTCGEARFNEVRSGRKVKKVPRQQTCTIPLGPQIQALRRSAESAHAMRYRDHKLQQIYDLYDIKSPEDYIYDDIYCGKDILELSEDLDLTSDDTTVIFSYDGAQLYQNKKSDTWIAIWIVTNYDPKLRYKIKHILPALIVPGPNKPKNLDSFLFRSFHHLSAIQREDGGRGIRVYDALKQEIVSSRTILQFITADAVALVELDGRVGHHGCHGCRKGCEMCGRHKPGSGHYYAAHLRPNNYTVADCNHPDFDFRNFKHQATPNEYEENLAKVVNSVDQMDYERNRKATGISKPSLVSGLLQRYVLRPPLCFTVDIMHLICLNLGELIIPLWRGTLSCESTDDKSTWDWAVLKGNTWTEHGKLVANATKYFPSSFHRPPRNPAEKISSGYKATEFYLYLFGLGIAFFRVILPEKYWKNFCKLARAVHIIMQRSITGAQAAEAHQYFIQFVEEFENLYYQRRVDRLHFTRPCLHSLLHLASEIFRVGNGLHTSQFMMERAVGELGRCIRQPSNMFANLIQITVRKAQINALKSINPELDSDNPSLPQYSHDLGDGYALLRPRDKMAQVFSRVELDEIGKVCDKEHRQRWGRAQLSNGQVAKSLYSENRRSIENTRVTRNVKAQINGAVSYCEVQFYFLDKDSDEAGEQTAYALVSVYGRPNARMLEESSNTLWACEYSGQNHLTCIPVKSILSVVSMQPLPRLPNDPEDLWFVVEKSGLHDIELDGYVAPFDT